MSLKKKKKDCLFYFVKAKTKERKKAFSSEAEADPASSGRVSFTTGAELLASALDRFLDTLHECSTDS